MIPRGRRRIAPSSLDDVSFTLLLFYIVLASASTGQITTRKEAELAELSTAVEPPMEVQRMLTIRVEGSGAVVLEGPTAADDPVHFTAARAKAPGFVTEVGHTLERLSPGLGGVAISPSPEAPFQVTGALQVALQELLSNRAAAGGVTVEWRFLTVGVRE